MDSNSTQTGAKICLMETTETENRRVSLNQTPKKIPQLEATLAKMPRVHLN